MSRVSAWIATLAVALAGCGAPEASLPMAEPTGTVVVGVMSDLEAGEDLDRLRVTMRAAGETIRDDTLPLAGGPALRFPAELRFEDLPDGTPVDVSLDAIDGLTPFLSRLASTRIVAGKTRLLRVWLQRECIASYHLQGGVAGPTCAAPETCISAACKDPFVPPSALEDYTADWATSFADACKPQGHGAPEVEIGQGETSYQPLADAGDGAEMLFEKGPQGGLHVWVAVRMRNLHQKGSITTISGSFPDLGTELGEIEVAYGYEPSAGGSCELYGLRYVIANSLNTSDAIAGAKLRLDVRVEDIAGDVGSGEAVVTLAH